MHLQLPGPVGVTAIGHADPVQRHTVKKNWALREERFQQQQDFSGLNLGCECSRNESLEGGESAVSEGMQVIQSQRILNWFKAFTYFQIFGRLCLPATSASQR